MNKTDGRSAPPAKKRFFRRAIWSAVIAAVTILLLMLFVLGIDVILLTFGGILFAVFLRALSDPIAKRTPLSEGWALLVIVLLLFLFVGGGSYLLAPTMAEQYDELSRQVPQIVSDLEEFLSQYGWGRQLLEAAEGNGNGEIAMAVSAQLLTILSTGSFYLLTVFFLGLFFAANPRWYVRGFLTLVFPARRKRTKEIIRATGEMLRWWLVGRALAMLMVGVSTMILLFAVGVPFAVLIGFIVGLLTFIPYVGPLLGTIPIALVAMLEGTGTMVTAVGIYAVIQHIEGYLLDPIIQQRVVNLPPAVTVVSQVLLGLVIGPLGITFATPLAAVGMVVTKEAYVKDYLKKKEKGETVPEA